jgi:hypothetical protein
VDEDGHAKLAGFTIPTLLDEDFDAAGWEWSTPIPWSAPEYDVLPRPPSDVYSFGCVCLEVLINRLTV